MGELGAVPIFVSRKRSFKSPQNPRVDFYAVVCEVINLRIAMFEYAAKI